VFVGVDIGTQSLKAVVCDGGLAVIGSASVAYQRVFAKPDDARKAAYDDAYGRYRDLFECLRPLYR